MSVLRNTFKSVALGERVDSSECDKEEKSSYELKIHCEREGDLAIYSPYMSISHTFNII
jgi:hypothetical protein